MEINDLINNPAQMQTKPEDDNEGKDSKDDLHPSVAKQLAELQQGQQHTSKLMQLVSDPDVMELIKAKEQGRKFRLVEDNGQQRQHSPLDDLVTPSENDPFKDVDIETLDNSGLAEYAAHKASQATMKQLTPVLKQLTESFSTKMQSVEQFQQSVQQQQAAQQVAEAARKYPDFETYRDDMADLYDKFPNATMDQLYTLAKQQRGTLYQHRAETEKPESSATGGRSQPKSKVRGSRGFEDALGQILRSKQINLGDTVKSQHPESVHAGSPIYITP